MSSGCNEQINRNHFSTLKPTGIEDGVEHFSYLVATGMAGQKCAPGSKNCKIDPNRRAKWPVNDPTAEQTRMEWLEKHLAEKGYANAEYSVVSRELIETRSVYDISYDIEVRTASSTVAGLVAMK